MARLRTAVLISGRGSNLQVLLKACSDPTFPAEIVLVIANTPDARGLEHAADFGVPAEVIDHRSFADRVSFDAALDHRLRAAEVGLICLAGFMRLLTAWFVERWWNQVINIHPSLLPAFRGLDTHQRALDAGVRVTGCTVHIVRSATDTGPIIIQAAVPVRSDDTADSLAARVLVAEHHCFPTALRLVAEGRARIDGERVILLETESPDLWLANPIG